MRVNYSEIQNNANSNSNNDFKVKLFGLKSGETAIVRFLIDSVDDFDIYVDHNNIEYDDKKYQRVNCIREANDPLNKCPLCDAGVSIEQVAYFKMIRYTSDSNGNIIAEPTIWSRSAQSAFVKDLVTYINMYGSLSDMICSITRTGSGFQDTKYTISPNLPEKMYPSNVYVNIPDAFEGYSVLGTLIRDWDFDQMNEFLRTGSNPVHRENNNSQTSNNNQYNNQQKYEAPNSVEDDGLPFNNPTNSYNQTETFNRPSRGTFDSSTMMQRPNRTY